MLAPVLALLFQAVSPDDRLAVTPHLLDYDPEMLHRYLMRRAQEHFARQDRFWKASHSPEEWKAYQQSVREKFLRMIGGLPQERTPLNPRTVGVLEYEDYRIEKVIYESRPEFYVTANVYVPKTGTPPYPAILSPCGHSDNGKAYETYQRACIAAAKMGYVVLIYDPISQGERLQVVEKETGRSPIGYGTAEHCHFGNQGYLIGINLAQIRIWDGIRSLDYLLSREDVDPERVGVMGNSGGGTLTTYLGVVDPRIRVIAPNCYITDLEYRLASRVTADPEQDLVPQVAEGVDHPDMLAVMAPRPVQIGAAIEDFFPIAGTRRTFLRLRRLYEALGAPEAIELIEGPHGHGFSQFLREGMIRWMNRWLQQPTPDYTEPSFEVESDERLLCTETGQVLTSLGGRTVFHLLSEAARERLPQRPLLETEQDLVAYRKAIREKVARVLAWEHPQTALRVRHLDTILEDGYRVEKLVFRSEEGIEVPALFWEAVGQNAHPAPAVIFVHEGGKTADLEAIRRWLNEGRRVLAIDPRGIGETKSRLQYRGDYYSRYGVETDLTYTSFMIGLPLLGLRVRDVVRAVDYLRTRTDVAEDQIAVHGVGGGALLALHAAVLDERIAEVVLEEMLYAYKALVLNERYAYHVNIFLPNVLLEYDLGDLAAAVAPRRLILRRPLDQMRQAASPTHVNKEYSIAETAYRILGRLEAFTQEW
ncbi:MAG: xylan esterase [Candidatus Poribacteria bacterium]|nr:MAG: xylan esterase [Candidatus Poribacteria bacterium]